MSIEAQERQVFVQQFTKIIQSAEASPSAYKAGDNFREGNKRVASDQSSPLEQKGIALSPAFQSLQSGSTLECPFSLTPEEVGILRGAFFAKSHELALLDYAAVNAQNLIKEGFSERHTYYDREEYDTNKAYLEAKGTVEKNQRTYGDGSKVSKDMLSYILKQVVLIKTQNSEAALFREMRRDDHGNPIFKPTPDFEKNFS